VRDAVARIGVGIGMPPGCNVVPGGHDEGAEVKLSRLPSH
jgi:hypothetical protein